MATALGIYTVEYGVHGASRITTREFDELDAATAHGERWSRSNSTGHYWAEVIDGSGKVVASFNVPQVAGA
jgi:hypothetical protein